ncbi:MAG TPA: FAD-dependent oxidoreductase [Pirellulales bacterium]|jgi:glycine/D-amino acid oxidase-like deaminating enzyme|nr:FAD-dependent oxidoreductase [Pirellulales bacterium]
MPRDWNRRDALIGLLGLPAVLAGCRGRDSTEAEFDGRIVGPSLELGHRIRDGLRITPANDAWEKTGIVIVGGGVAGLSAAWRLLKADCEDFVLLELERAAGGTAQSGTSPAGVSVSTPFPWGAHYIPAPTRENAALIKLLSEMSILEGSDADREPIVAEQFLCRDPQERIFYRGHWHEGLYLHAGASADDLAQYGRFQDEINRWVAWRDGRGRRAFGIPIVSASDDPEVRALDKLSMADWLAEHSFISPRLCWLVDYACRDDYGLTVGQTSAWAGLFYFASRIVRSGAEPRPLITWPEGNGRLVAHLSAGLARQARLGMAAIEVIPVERDGRSSVDIVALSQDGRTARGFRAERVIFAAPQFIARHVVRPYRDDPPRHLSEFQYGTWLVANVFLRNRPAERGFPLAWDNVVYESPSLGYVTATHQRGPESGPTALTYYYPFCDDNPRRARERLLDLDWRTCAELALADLAIPHPDVRPLVERIDVMRWGHAMIRPVPGFIWGLHRPTAAQPYRKIHFANTDLSGVALFEEAFYHGIRAAEEALLARGRRIASYV